MKKAFNSAATPLKAGREFGISSHISAYIITDYCEGFNMSNEKRFYIQQINELMEKCNDLPLLDLIFKLLIKSV